jgi:hypothetical protein
MNAELKTFLSGMAKCADLTIEFPDGAPIRISGYHDGDSPFFLINTDQPDSELIFTILQKIGLVPVHSDNYWSNHLPSYLNHPYENEFAGEVVYKTRRAVRQKLNTKWRAGLWALCAYVQIPCAAQFVQFLKRHPEKMILMPLVWYGIQKTQIQGKFSTSFRILYCMFAAKLS